MRSGKHGDTENKHYWSIEPVVRSRSCVSMVSILVVMWTRYLTLPT